MRFADDAKLAAYEAKTATPMLVLAGGFLVIYSVQVIPPSMPSLVTWLLMIANWLIWLIFVTDLTIRLVLAQNKWSFVMKNPVDIASVVLPALRPVRALKVFTAGQRMLGTRSGLAQAGQAIVFAAGLLIYVGALAMLDVERGADGSMVTSFGDALWWALVTVTTVGYGDIYPVTAEGRVVASALMVLGISVLGAVTATAASWLLHSNDEKEEASVAKNEQQIRELQRRIDGLEAKIDVLIERGATPAKGKGSGE